MAHADVGESEDSDVENGEAKEVDDPDTNQLKTFDMKPRRSIVYTAKKQMKYLNTCLKVNQPIIRTLTSKFYKFIPQMDWKWITENDISIEKWYINWPFNIKLLHA